MKTLIIIFSSFFLFFGPPTFEADVEKSSIVVKGTSSVHDWESEVEDFVITGQLLEDKIVDLNVKVKTRSIESGKSIMDDKTYDALRAESHPTIVFEAPELAITNGKITGKGTLTLAGKSKPITIEPVIKENKATTMTVTGKVPMKMSEFGIEPPTAMFGTLTTGDEVVIDYEIILNK